MDLAQLPIAAEELYNAIRSAKPLDHAMEDVLAEFDVTEVALRKRFELHYKFTPEEFARRNVTDGSIEAYLLKYRADRSGLHPSRTKYLGRRFFLGYSDKFNKKKRWYRFLSSHGHSVRCVNELTYVQGEITDNDIIDDIARQIGWRRWSHWPISGPQSSLLYNGKE